MSYPELAEWIKSFNFFNWLAVAAFFLALFGFLNSFLSLRDRFKDWYSTRSKKSFTKRLQILQQKAKRFSELRKSKEKFFRELLDRGMLLLMLILLGLVSLVGGLIQKDLDSPILGLLFYYLSMFSFGFGGFLCLHIRDFYIAVQTGSMLDRISELVKKGEKRGHISKEQADEIVKEMKPGKISRGET